MESYGSLWTVQSGAKTVIGLATQGVKVVTYIKTACSRKTSEAGKPIITDHMARITERGGARMDRLSKDNYVRTGRPVDMSKLLEEMDHKYLLDLSASAKEFDTYDEVSNETFDDLRVVKGQLYLLERLGYLTNEEREDISSAAEDMRLKKLEGLSNGSGLQNNS